MKKEKGFVDVRPLHILLIEDSDADAHLVEIAARKYMKGAKLSRATTFKEGTNALQMGKTDILLLDLGLPDTAGPEDTYTQVKQWMDNLPVIIMTSLKDRRQARRMVYEGVADFLNKDIIFANPKIIHNAIEFSIERHAAVRKLAAEKARAQKESKEKDTILSCFIGGYSVSR